jgi:RHS repeat-associated protein
MVCFTRSRFTGKERDTESGNDYFGARYYASTMGRFMSPDWAAKEEGSDPVPYADLTNPQSLNLYSYVNNNPLSKTDKDGHCPECMVLVDDAIQYISESPAGEAAGNLIMEGAAAGGALLGAALSGGGNAYPSYYHGEFQNTFSSDNSATANPPRTAQDPLPRDKDGRPVPDPEAAGNPHTQLGTKDGRNGPYTQGREFDANGKPVKDIDHTDHGRPKDHTNPHEHPYRPSDGKRMPQQPVNPIPPPPPTTTPKPPTS